MVCLLVVGSVNEIASCVVVRIEELETRLFVHPSHG